MIIQKKFDKYAINAFKPDAKIGLLATINSENLPHITLITSMIAKNESQLIWGQFSEGQSKKNVKQNPKTAFLIMNKSFDIWRGNAKWIEEKKEGDEFIEFNKKPMFRYNAYFGIHTVHYMDLIQTYGKENLPFLQLASSTLLTRFFNLKHNLFNKNEKNVLKSWAKNHLNHLLTLKYLSYIKEDGFPELIPIIQCIPLNSSQLIFSTLAYKKEFQQIRKGSIVAVFGLNMQMESVLIRGIYDGFNSLSMIEMGLIDVNWVYNSMPPIPGQVYPEIEIKKIISF